jgi:hypothetical protein
MTELKAVRGLALAGAGAVSVYAGMAAAGFLRYRRARRRGGGDALLDRFLPEYDIVERHHTDVDAPADATMAAAMEMDLERSAIVRAIFRARELAMRAKPPARELPRGMVESVKAMGWGVLAEIPGREIVFGAVTQPWRADVVFRALAPEEFERFDDPGFVKIAWTLRADPAGERRSVFRTETRAIAIGPEARRRVRRYWSLVAPGVILIRRLSLGLVRSEARRRMELVAREA